MAATLASAMERLGRYVLDKRLAWGGMAEVFLAKQSGPEGFEKVCVVKRMLPNLTEEPKFVAMFLDEARLAAKLSHPGIAQIFDFGQQGETYFIAMEHIAGVHLGKAIEAQRELGASISVAVAARIVSLVASALDYAHNAVDERGESLGIIHRDVSPQNVMLSYNGDVKLIDFGIAKAASASSLTKTGTLKGKYAYMSPEQLSAEPLDRRTDVYALGLVLYELLAGRRAVRGNSEAALVKAAMTRDFPPLQSLRPDVPPEVLRAVERSTAAAREERYATAAELADALEEFLSKNSVRVKAQQIAALLPPPTPQGQGAAPGARSGAGSSPAAKEAASDVEVGVETAARPQTRADAPAALVAATNILPKTPLPSLRDGDDASADESTDRLARTVPQSVLSSETRPSAPRPMYSQLTGSESGRPTLENPAAGVELGEPTVVGRPIGATVAIIALLLVGAAAGWYVLRSPNTPSEPVESALAMRPQVDAGVVALPVVMPVADAAVSVATAPAETPTPEAQRVVDSGTTAPTGAVAVAVKDSAVKAVSARPTVQRKGTVLFRVIPWGEVFLDGKSVGVTPFKPLELDPGTYRFRIECSETRQSKWSEVRVTPGGQAVVKADLRGE